MVRTAPFVSSHPRYGMVVGAVRPFLLCLLLLLRLLLRVSLRVCSSRQFLAVFTETCLTYSLCEESYIYLDISPTTPLLLLRLQMFCVSSVLWSVSFGWFSCFLACLYRVVNSSELRFRLLNRWHALQFVWPCSRLYGFSSIHNEDHGGCSTGRKYLHCWLQMPPLRRSVVPAKFSASRILETPFQSTIKCVARTSKKLYAECRVVKRHEYVPRGF